MKAQSFLKRLSTICLQFVLHFAYNSFLFTILLFVFILLLYINQLFNQKFLFLHNQDFVFTFCLQSAIVNILPFVYNHINQVFVYNSAVCLQFSYLFTIQLFVYNSPICLQFSYLFTIQLFVYNSAVCLDFVVCLIRRLFFSICYLYWEG